MARSRFKRNKMQQPRNPEENFAIKLFKNVDENIKNLKKMLDEPDDLITREFTVGQKNHKCAIVYIDGLVDNMSIQNNILKNLQINMGEQQLPDAPEEVLDIIYQEKISISDIKEGKTLDDVSNAILSGDTVFFLDQLDVVLIIDTKGGEHRQIEEPQSETLVRGPREGFIEDVGTNVALLRRYIQDPNLRFKTHQIGRRGKRKLVVSYVDGIIHPDIVKEVNRRLKTIDMDDAPESGFIEEWIEDSRLSPFPQIQNTERPDATAKALLQGKIAILLDGTPFVLIAPLTLSNALQSAEDYNERWTIGTLLRGLRYLAAFISLFLPALYIALIAFHPGLIPSKLTFSIAASREGVPFPAFVEAVTMGITMELLREAGARLPKTIGDTIGIVGGLVIGEAAVQAGIVSPIMVIIVALTAIASFSMPTYSLAIAFRMIRFAFMIAAAVLGLYGIILVYIMINIHIVNLTSIGVPYSTPFAPSFFRDWKDLVLRAPITMLTRRPAYMDTNDSIPTDKGEEGS